MRKALLGDVEIDVLENESPEYNNTITDKPVERDVDIADHVRNTPITQSLSCVFAGAEAEEKYERLKEHRNKGERLLFVSGLDVMPDMVIESLSPSRDVSIADGFTVDITLKQIRIAQPEEAVYVAPDPVEPDPQPGDEEKNVDPETKAEQHLGTQQPIEGSVDDQQRESALMKVGRAAYEYGTRAFEELR